MHMANCVVSPGANAVSLEIDRLNEEKDVAEVCPYYLDLKPDIARLQACLAALFSTLAALFSSKDRIFSLLWPSQ